MSGSKRTPLRRNSKRRITDQAIAAWRSCDHLGLLNALGLTGRSPLPKDVCALGVDEGETLSGRCWDRDYDEVLSLQRELYALVGPPDTEALRAAYQHHIDNAAEMVGYYREIIADPSRGGSGYNDINIEIERRKRGLAEELEEIRYYEELLAALDAEADGDGGTQEA